MTTHLRVTMLPVLALAMTAAVHAATVSDPAYKVVCYFESWGIYRPGNGRHDVEDIDPDLCTHHVYAFAGLNDNHEITSLDPYRDLDDNFGQGAYLRFTNLKERSPQIKTMISVGGWNEGCAKYSEMVSTAENRATFVQSVLDFLAKYNFDGIDMDWEYPTQRDGAPADKANFALLLKDLSEALSPRGLLLSSGVAAGIQIIQAAYDLEEMAKYLDWMNVMTFDYHGTWDNFADHSAPIYYSQKDVERGEAFTWLNVNYTIHYYMGKGVPPSKLMMGFPVYGRGFTLRDPANHAPYDLASGPMEPCPYSGEAGFCGYLELCEQIFSESGWTDVRDDEMKVIYSYKDDTWIGWDDIQTVQAKVDYLKSTGLGGAMLWSIDMDDFHGLCGGTSYPVTSAIWTGLNGS